MIWPIAFLLAGVLVELHGLGGQRIFVNPDLVVNIRVPHGTDQGHWGRGLQCLVMTTDGKYIAVAETCDVVKEKLESAGKVALPL